MNKEEIKAQLVELNTLYVRVAVTDIDGLLRGKLMHKSKLLKALDSSFGFCDVIFGWDSTDALYAKDSFTGWYKGFPDAQASLDVATFRILPWVDDTPMLLADFSSSVPDLCPRSILKKIANEVESMGYKAMAAMEFEWFNFKKEADKTPVSGGMFGYSILRSGQFHTYWNSVFEGLETAHIPLEGLHTETGPGAMEAAIQKTNFLEAGDRAVLFKSFIKEIGIKYDISSSFMAKWNATLPGCSGHLHQSLWKDNYNLFAPENGKMTELQENYLAGVLYALPDLLPVYAPTINSYKRLAPDTWAPTTISWGVENRTTSCRIINTNTDQSRIELRVPGADNNPYLCFAASLASGLYGIKHKLKLEQPETKGNAYQNDSLEKLPTTLKDATSNMKNSKLAKELLGETFVDHFVMTREWEVNQHERAVSNWEVERYFEGI